MAIYHFSVHVISRRAGRSAVKAAAWCAGERLRDELTGELADFTRCPDVLHSAILTPAGAPIWMADRGRLWNAVGAAEKRIDILQTKTDGTLAAEPFVLRDEPANSNGETNATS